MSVLFAGFEAANRGAIDPVLRELGDLTTHVLPAFDFKAVRPTPAPAPAPTRTPAPTPTPTPTPAPDAIVAAALGAVRGRAYMGWLQQAHAEVARATLDELSARRPRLVVVAEDTDYIRGRLILHIARRLELRTAVLLPIWYAMMRDYPLLGARLADHYLLPDDETASRYAAAGVGASRLHVVGSPQLDAATTATRAPVSPPRLLLPLQNQPWERLLVSDLAAIAAARDVELIVKQHPRSAHPAFAPGERLGPRGRVVEGGAMHEWIGGASVVVGQTSRALWEAALRGVPIVVASYGFGAPPLRLPAPLEPARTAAALATQIDAALAGAAPVIDPRRLTAHPGEAAGRAARALRELLA